MTGTGRAPRQGRAASGLLVALGALAALALWFAWEPTTQQCDTLGACLSRAFTGIILAALLVLAMLMALWLLRLRPVFLTTLFAVVCGGALVVSLGEVVAVGGLGARSEIAPLWSWVLVGAVVLPLVHWLLQPGRSWVARVVPLVAIGLLAWAAMGWADDQRRDRRLAQLESVGVDAVLLPALDPGHELSYSGRRTVVDGGGFFISMSYRPTGSGTAYPDAHLVPVRDRQPCDLVVAIEWRSERGDCTADGDTLVVQNERLVGAGVIRQGTLLLVTGDTEDFTLRQMRDAVAGAEPGTVEDLLGD